MLQTYDLILKNWLSCHNGFSRTTTLMHGGIILSKPESSHLSYMYALSKLLFM